jgi:hypothetical protein
MVRSSSRYWLQLCLLPIIPPCLAAHLSLMQHAVKTSPFMILKATVPSSIIALPFHVDARFVFPQYGLKISLLTTFKDNGFIQIDPRETKSQRGERLRSFVLSFIRKSRMLALLEGLRNDCGRRRCGGILHALSSRELLECSKCFLHFWKWESRKTCAPQQTDSLLLNTTVDSFSEPTLNDVVEGSNLL